MACLILRSGGLFIWSIVLEQSHDEIIAYDA